MAKGKKAGGRRRGSDRTGIYRDDRYLAGGMRVGAYPRPVFLSFNLTTPLL